MKKIAYILSYLTAALCIFSCEKPLEGPDSAISGTGSDGAKATFTFTPAMMDAAMGPVGTKAMLSTPQIHNLYFAVFDNAGYKLSEYAQAVPNTYANDNWNPANPEANIFSYSVTLTVTDQPRIIHIIANAPEHLIYGSEAEVIGSLNTRYGATESEGDWSDAYWVRIYLDRGVWAKPDESTRETDPKFQEKYDNWEHVVQTLDGAKLVRNFARITLEEDADDFVLTRYWLTNIPDIGSYAPYNRNTGHFQIDYSSYTTIDDLASEEGGNYPGFFPASADLIKIGDYLDDQDMLDRMESNAGKNWTSYCYEREFPREDPVYLIVAGRLNGGDESFYKIDLRDHDNNYFPLLRNFTYKVRITNVSTQGASSLSGALSNAPSGAVDTSLEMQGLTNISNGTAQLFVSETSEIIVGEGHDIPLRYKFIPSLTTDANEDGYADAVNTVIVKGSSDEETARNNHNSYVTISRSNGITGPVFSAISVQNGYDSDNYSDIILRSNDASGIIKTETITITGHYWNKVTGKYETISRTSNFKLRETLHMQVAFSPAKIPEGRGQNVDLVISLEAGLPSSMFSLDFNIEMLGLTLTTNNDPLPVTTGKSQVAGNSKPAYHFLRTITWTEYENAAVVDGYKQFVCHFKTNTGTIPDLSPKQSLYESAGGQEETLPSKKGDIVNVQNKYFVQQAAYYSVYSPMEFTAINITGAAAVGQEGELTFTMESPFPNGASSTKVTVGLSGFEPTDLGTYPMKGSKDGYELYELTVYSTVVDGVPAYQGRMSVVPYDSGTCSVRLSADEYETKSMDANVREGIYIYINEDGSGSGDRMVQAVGYAATPEGSVIAGQKAKLTVYIAEIESTATVTIGEVTASRSSTYYLDIKGKRYYRYVASDFQSSAEGTNESPGYGACMQPARIKIDGVTAKIIKVPVYGIQLGPTALNSASPKVYTNTWYVFRNAAWTTYHLYNTGSYLAGSNSAIDYYSLIGFSSTSANAKIVVLADGGLRYVSGTGRKNSISYVSTVNSSESNGTDYTLDNSGSYIAPSSNTGRFWQQSKSDGNVYPSSDNNYRKFYIYPVTLIPPSQQ